MNLGCEILPKLERDSSNHASFPILLQYRSTRLEVYILAKKFQQILTSMIQLQQIVSLCLQIHRATYQRIDNVAGLISRMVLRHCSLRYCMECIRITGALLLVCTILIYACALIYLHGNGILDHENDIIKIQPVLGSIDSILLYNK